jgi:hypothetical protein
MTIKGHNQGPMIVPRAHREDFGELYQSLIRNLSARQIELFQADGRARWISATTAAAGGEPAARELHRDERR